MWLVVGLGNPGSKYARNRHNIGFQVVDELARKHGLPAWKTSKLGGDTTTGLLSTPTGRDKAFLLKPMEFMNLSGFAVQRTADFHDIAVDKIVVVHDEIDLDVGIVRLKNGGGHGGHNGLRSMIDQLGSNAFARVRVGVAKGHPEAIAAAAAAGRALKAGEKDVAGWVLSDFPSAQASTVSAMVGASIEAVEAIVGRGITAAMNQLNGRPTLAA